MRIHLRTLGYGVFIYFNLLLTACGGGGSGDVASTTSNTTLELIDPTPGSSDKFGSSVVILGNGNIAVTDPNDSSIATNNGAVHLYDALTQTLIASLYGDSMDDHLGSGGITILVNNNFVVVSPNDDVNGIVDSGSVRLVDGTTGAQIGSALAGDVASDQLGYGGDGVNGITALGNDNFVIASIYDDEGGVVDSGSVRLVDGTTGAQIGGTLAGDVTGDQLGNGGSGVSGITVLGNNNFVIASVLDNEGGFTDAGSVILVNGVNGTQIGSTLAGDVASDRLGDGGEGVSGITALGNGNFVVASVNDDEGGVTNAGSVRLMNGTTGTQIGSTLVGDVANDRLGEAGVGVSGISALQNNNFVIASVYDDEGGIVDSGSVRLVDGMTGVQIGGTLAGDVTGDRIGQGSIGASGFYNGTSGITALGNNNYVVASTGDDEGGITNAGSVRLMNGTTGTQIGGTLAGDDASDRLGYANDRVKGITALGNNNYVIVSCEDDENGIPDAGSVRLVNGTTGAQIGSPLAGDAVGDKLGYASEGVNGITILGNNNFVIASILDNEGGIVDAGSVRLVDGMTGAQIGSTLAGDTAADNLGYGGSQSGVTDLGNNHYVIVSFPDDVNGVVDAGSVRLVNGTTGTQIGSMLAGDVASDRLGINGITVLRNNNYVITTWRDNENGVVNAGSVRLADGSTGAQIGSTMAGSATNDMIAAQVIESANGDFYILSLPNADHNGMVDSGRVQLIAE